MKIFLTGATGFIGSQLAVELANKGHQVNALVRSVSRAKKEADHEGIHFFEGGLDDLEVAKKAMEGCEHGFLLAAFAQVWDKDPDTFYRINVRNNLELAKAAFSTGIKKIVITSTAGVFGPSKDGEMVHEKSVKWTSLTTDYELSKSEAEIQFKNYAKESGNHVVLVNPTRVYGPGKLSPSNSVTRMIKEYAEGKWHFYPGDGNAIGNYVFVEDVIRGHILAMEKGVSGKNYILGGENASYKELFQKVKIMAGKSTWLIGVPIPMMMFIAKFQMMMIPITKKGPLLTPGFVRKYNFSWKNSSDYANEELGYSGRSLEDGIKEVINWANKNK